MSTYFSSLGHFEERIEPLISSRVHLAKKSTFFLSRLVLLLSFWKAFFGSRFWYDFLTSSMLVSVKLKSWDLFLALISFMLGWPLKLSIIYKIGSSSDESEHLYPWLDILKFGIFIKYLLHVLAIYLLQEIIFSLSFRLILELLVSFWERNGLLVFRNVLLSVTALVSRLKPNSFFSFGFHF